MTVDYVEGEVAVANNTTLIIPEPAGSIENDLMVFFGWISAVDGSWGLPADFTLLDSFTELTGSQTVHNFVATKRRGADAGNGYQCTYSGSAAGICAGVLAYRNVNAANIFDEPYVRASHYNAAVNDPNHPAAPITVNNDLGKVVILYQASNTALSSFGPPATYQQRKAAGGSNRNIYACDKAAGVGLETPGVFTHVGNDTQDPRKFILALRESSIGGALSVSVQLADIDGNNRANLVGVRYFWHDAPPSTGISPTDAGEVNTDGSGQATIILANTTLIAGQTGYILMLHPDTGFLGTYALVIA